MSECNYEKRRTCTARTPVFVTFIFLLFLVKNANSQYPQPKFFSLSKSNPNPNMSWLETSSTQIRVGIRDEGSESLLPVGYIRDYFRNVSDLEVVDSTLPREITIAVKAYQPESVTFVQIKAYRPNEARNSTLDLFWSGVTYGGSLKIKEACELLCSELNNELESYRADRKAGKK